MATRQVYREQLVFQRRVRTLLMMLCISLVGRSEVKAFVFPWAPSCSSRDARKVTHLWVTDRTDQQTLYALRERQTRLALMEAQLALKGLQEVFLLGQTKLRTPTQSRIRTEQHRTCLVVSPRQPFGREESLPALLVPLSSPAQLRLLSFVVASRPLSQAVLLGLNALLVNRDGALFDNLPWSRWSVDPQKRNYDAAGNPILEKFHLGKRDAYNRLLGKDWQGRSVSIGNMALRLKYMLEAKADEPANVSPEDDLLDTDGSKASLAQRILELQIRELEMDLAEWDYQLAISRNNQPDNVKNVEDNRRACKQQLKTTRSNLQALLEEKESQEDDSISSTVTAILQTVADWTTDYGKNQAPYRGAMGYAPMLDTETDIEGSTLPYTSPYDLLREILDDQLNAEVIGSVLENTSLLNGTLALGGALLLRRKIPKKTVTLAGEQVQISDEEEDFGNLAGKGGETLLVECDADEALAMGLTCNVPIHVEPGILDRASVMAIRIGLENTKERPTGRVQDALPLWKPQDPELSLLEEGKSLNGAATGRALPIRIPRTTTSLFDSIFAQTPPDAASGMFPTDNPVRSLSQYDEFSNEDKARTLMTMSNFDGKLPRPRVLRTETASRQGRNTLDDLLIPLIDESVRRQLLMRDAEMRGDTVTVELLRNEKTKRQIAKEKAEEARRAGEEDVARRWEEEAELYGDLRADVTQDEGAYSRFLDRDEWYERTRRAQAKKLDKKKFGSLLDGID